MLWQRPRCNGGSRLQFTSRDSHAGAEAWGSCSAGSWLCAEKETFELSIASGGKNTVWDVARAKGKKTDWLEKPRDTQHDCTFGAY